MNPNKQAKVGLSLGLISCMLMVGVVGIGACCGVLMLVGGVAEFLEVMG